MNKNKGFTLIELLVVIAIIGILSSVVLASLSNARSKGKDASVKSQLASMKAQGELFYSTNETYMGVCAETSANNGFAGLLSSTVSVSGVSEGATLNTSYTSGEGSYLKVTCHEKLFITDGTSKWAVEAPLSDSKTGAASMYCVDSTGISKVETGDANLLGDVTAGDTTTTGVVCK